MAYLQTAASTADSSSYTFLSQNFGTADADRYIVVAVAARASGSITNQINAITIGGVSASIISQRFDQGGGGTNVTGIAIAHVPSGTSGDVVVAFNNTQLRCVVSMYAETLNSTTAYRGTGNNTTTSLSIDIPANGVLIAIATASVGTNATWSGATEDYDAVTETFITVTTARYVAASDETGHLVNATFITPTGPLSKTAVSFPAYVPGSGGGNRRRRVLLAA